MRGLRAQFLAPVAVVVLVTAVGALLDEIILGLVLGGGIASLAVWLLARHAAMRLEQIEDVARHRDVDLQALSVQDVRDEVDEALRSVAQGAIDDEQRRVLDVGLLEQQALVLDRMNDGLMRVGVDRRVTYANVAAVTLFGGRNPAGRSFLSVVRDHELSEALDRCLTTGEEQQHTFEIPGEGRLVNAVIIPLLTRPAEALVTLRDITEVNRLQNLRRDFAANVSHELRTPLSTIKILTETLLDIRGDDEEAAQFLRKIDAEVDSMTALVRDLLDLTKLEAPGGRLALREIDAVLLIRDVCDRMRPLADRQHVRLQAKSECDAIELVADERRLHQALLNLVTNAIAHTPAGGMVTVSAHEQPAVIVFTVQDTGSGIAREHLARIWERFFKTDRARTGPGTGLGLAIVKHIAQAHGGTVAVESALGEGAKFTIAIPRSLRTAHRLPPAAEARMAPP